MFTVGAASAIGKRVLLSVELKLRLKLPDHLDELLTRKGRDWKPPILHLVKLLALWLSLSVISKWGFSMDRVDINFVWNEEVLKTYLLQGLLHHQQTCSSCLNKSHAHTSYVTSQSYHIVILTNNPISTQLHSTLWFLTSTFHWYRKTNLATLANMFTVYAILDSFFSSESKYPHSLESFRDFFPLVGKKCCILHLACFTVYVLLWFVNQVFFLKQAALLRTFQLLVSSLRNTTIFYGKINTRQLRL